MANCVFDMQVWLSNIVQNLMMKEGNYGFGEDALVLKRPGSVGNAVRALMEMGRLLLVYLELSIHNKQ